MHHRHRRRPRLLAADAPVPSEDFLSTTRMRTRRAVAAMTAGCLAVAGAALTLAGPAGAVPGFQFERLEGADRYATAAAIARDTFPTSDVVLLANGQSDDPRTSANESHFPDALAGSYLAGFRGAPTLLTTEDTLPDVTSRAITDLGAETVVIIGGPAAVGSGQEQQLRSRGLQVQRVSGPNRYSTAAAVARNPGASNVGTVNGRRTAVVASGVQFPDALVMGPLSYASRLPLTITDPQRLSPETRSVLDELDIQQVLIPGGESAVSRDVQREIEGLGITVTRFAGAGRTETAALVAEYALANLNFTDAHVNLALGLRFPDALSGGPHAGRDRAPILLTAGVDTLGAASRGYLEDHSDTLEDGHIFGGPAAVSSRVETEAEQAAQGDGTTASPSPSPTGTGAPTTSCDGTTASPSPSDSPTATMNPSPTVSPAPGSETPTTVTSRPELVSVELALAPSLQTNGTTDTRDDFCATSVRFTFDEEVIGRQPVAERFVLVGFEPTARFTGRTAVIEASGTSVVVSFGRGDNLTTTANERQDVGTAQLADISLAVVDLDAVADNAQQGNPIGDRPFGQSRSVPTFPAGITAAPDLVDATLGTVTTTTTTVRFEFDETVASINRSTGFHVVTGSNTDNTCGSPVISGTSVTATCASTATDPIVRAYVESDTVSDASSGGNLNVLHAEGVDDSDTTIAPDLVAAEFIPGGSANDDDRVLFTFDEDVFIGDNTRFVVYQQDTDEIRSVSAVRQSNPTQVLATFPDAVSLLGDRTPALTNAVGASVLEGAVIEAGGVNRPNQEDEIGVLNAARNTVIAGTTQGPDLTSVSINATQNTATFTFDEALSARETVFTRLSLFRPDGTRLVCQLGTVSSSAGTVTCTAFTSGNTPAEPDAAVVGTADDAAVRDSGGTPNPEGAAGVS